jgi:hypothetical protein
MHYPLGDLYCVAVHAEVLAVSSGPVKPGALVYSTDSFEELQVSVSEEYTNESAFHTNFILYEIPLASWSI